MAERMDLRTQLRRTDFHENDAETDRRSGMSSRLPRMEGGGLRTIQILRKSTDAVSGFSPYFVHETVNMVLLGRVKNILKAQAISDVQASDVRLSYVEKLFPELQEQGYIVLHKSMPAVQTPQGLLNTPQSETVQTAEFDITGSPLKYTFNTINFEDTVVTAIRNWDKLDEDYHPLSRTDANAVLNLCLEYLNNDCTIPLIALCDGEDEHKTRLLGTVVKDGRFTTIEGCFEGIHTFSALKNSSSALCNEHLKLARVRENEVTISTSSTFNVLGANYEMQDWNADTKNDFEGYLSIEVDGDSLSWDTSAMTSKLNLVLQIMTGWSGSPLNELWKELVLLSQYLSIIEEYNKQPETIKYSGMPLEFPSNFVPPRVKEYQDVVKHVNMLVCGNYSYIQTDNHMSSKCLEPEENADYDVKLEILLEELALKQNLDFIDLLWEELIGISDYIQMTNCLRIVLKEFASNQYQAQMDISNATRIGQTILKLNQGPDIIENLLTGSLPLKLVTDMGFEKLSREYIHVLTSARFIDRSDIPRIFKNISSGEFATDNYREKLRVLLQIHISLEFMLRIQMNLGISTNSMQTMFEHAYEKFSSDEAVKRDVLDLSENKVYNLTEQIHGALVKNYDKGVPVCWRVILSSSAGLSKTTTTAYYSQTPIFPPTIYPIDELNTEEESFHTMKIVTSSLKIK